MNMQSQRDCIIQPRVARNELPWVIRHRLICNPERVASISVIVPAGGRNPFRVVTRVPVLPRVARSSQPWALLRHPFGILLFAAFWLAIALPGRAATILEDFATNPALRGWRAFGDASLFHWNAVNQNLEVTWDSSHTNSFYFLPLGTVLTHSDDFTFSFDVRLSDIRVGSTPGKSNEFEIAIGLINYRSATNSKAFRGAGVSATYGVRNIVEFDYFPDAGFGDTFATTVISTNNVFSPDQFPDSGLTLSLGDTFRLTLSYVASNQILHTAATKNGLPFSPLADVALAGKPDFRVDSFAVTSYSDAVQTGSPIYYGSVLAHGIVDNVQLTVPPITLPHLQVRQTNAMWLVEFAGVTNWIYTLEGSADFSMWTAVAPAITGTGVLAGLRDTNAPTGMMFYRVRAERP